MDQGSPGELFEREFKVQTMQSGQDVQGGTFDAGPGRQCKPEKSMDRFDGDIDPRGRGTIDLWIGLHVG